MPNYWVRIKQAILAAFIALDCSFTQGKKRERQPPTIPTKELSSAGGVFGGGVRIAGTQAGRPIFIQCWFWEELRSPYEDAKPQPSTG